MFTIGRPCQTESRASYRFILYFYAFSAGAALYPLATPRSALCSYFQQLKIRRRNQTKRITTHALPVMPDSLLNDPPPVPPVCPSDDECCRSGCDPCVFDRYAEEMERYRADLRDWEERRAARNSGAER